MFAAVVVAWRSSSFARSDARGLAGCNPPFTIISAAATTAAAAAIAAPVPPPPFAARCGRRYPPSLRVLSFMRNAHTGPVPIAALARLPQLQRLHLNGNPGLVCSCFRSGGDDGEKSASSSSSSSSLSSSSSVGAAASAPELTASPEAPVAATTTTTAEDEAREVLGDAVVRAGPLRGMYSDGLVYCARS